MSFITAYSLFIAKAITVFIIVAGLFILFFALTSRSKKKKSDQELDVTFLNSELIADKFELESELLDKADIKKLKKNPIKPNKDNKRLFVIDFDGDIHASETDFLRREITAIIQTANPEKDRVLLRLESPGGVVHGYGLAAAQLARLKEANIPLSVAVDKVAASGGYMMACVAQQIIAAPFSIIGSIGVVAQVPNINRLLKEKNVDIELHTAGKYKRTLTLLGENTKEGREKFKEDLELTYNLFKSHIEKNRPNVDIESVATGETWYGQQAISNHLVDKIQTSDDFILESVKDHDIYVISIEQKQGMIDKIKSQFLKSKATKFAHQYFL